MSALTRANNKSTTDQLNVQLDFFMQFSGAGFSAVETSAFGHVVGFRHLFFPAVAAFPPRPLSKKKKKQEPGQDRATAHFDPSGVGLVSSTRLSLEPVEKMHRG